MQAQATVLHIDTFKPLHPSPSRASQILQNLPQALLVMLADRRLVFANARAEALATTGCVRHFGGRVTSLGQLGAPQIEELLRRTQTGHDSQVGLWFAAMRTGWLSASRLPLDISRSADWPADSLLLLIHPDEPRLTQQARVDALCKHCKLTSAERYVLLLLADGLAAQDVAQQLSLKVSTVRSHIRNLLAKTHSASLMQLVQQLGSKTPLTACH